jgi:hypothetical protein
MALMVNEQPPHGIERAEWERRFAQRIAAKRDLTGQALADVVNAELVDWPPTSRSWRTVQPEDAADEQLAFWD